MHIPATHARAARLYGPQFADNPAQVYRELRRQHGPVAPALLEGDVPVWLVLAYREVLHVTSNPQVFGRNSRRWALLDQLPPDWPLAPFVAWSPSVLHAEGADHQRRAGVISDALDAIDRTDLTRACTRTADELIDEFALDGKADLITQYATRLPITVMARLSGIPEADVPALSADLLLSLIQAPGTIEAHMRAFGRIAALVQDLPSGPGTGIAARMAAHPAGLSADELTIDLHMTMAGAQQPTADWIGNALRLMLMDDEFSLTLQGGRSSVEQALNEVLWEDPPVQNMVGRWALQDYDLGGQRISKGDMLVLSLASANADPQARPGSASGTGRNRAHVSFATGEHSCPYAAPEIAEIIARVAIEVLLDRLPDVTLAVSPRDLHWKESPVIRSLHSLPVTFTPMHTA